MQMFILDNAWLLKEPNYGHITPSSGGVAQVGFISALFWKGHLDP